MDNVATVLANSAIVLEFDTQQTRENIARCTDWSSHPIWLAYATRLDQSQVMFYRPDMYDALVILTSEEPGYYEAYTRSGDITLNIVGVYKDNQPFGPFWNENLPLRHKGISQRALRLLKFGKKVQKELESNKDEWLTSFFDSEIYLSTHRSCARRVGRVLGVDMENHDLTKTRIVQVALAYTSHWLGDESMRCANLMQLARDAIKAGHLELENYNLEFHGDIDYDKMFTNKVAVHLQEDAPDDDDGWLLNPGFIPDQCKEQWKLFRAKHTHLNLYELVWNDLLKETELNQRKDLERWIAGLIARRETTKRTIADDKGSEKTDLKEECMIER